MSGVSVKTIKSPEFINITSISPLVSKCEIKVLYVGQNRNRSAITKEVAAEMAQTLPGVPIVGYYSESKEDFRDHGEQIVWDGDGIKFNCLTRPYGFVAPDAKVWFQEFEDTDDFGNKTLREYLMCTGYLWTEQYEEAKKIVNEGRPQSMELDDNTLKGYWSTDSNRGIDFFIINDATITKLCALGTDVEPCFEGALITAPDVSASFTKDEKVFTKTIYSMMQELKELTFALKGEGGEKMEQNENKVPETAVEEPATVVTPEENFSNVKDNVNSENNNENQVIVEEFKKNSEDEEKKPEEKEEGDSTSDDKKDEAPAKEDEGEKKEEEEPKKKHSLEEELAEVNAQFTQLKADYEALKAENESLVAFKKAVEDSEKDALINSFSMLSDEDKKEVVENKSNYTLDEIKSKLAVICYDKKVSFAVEKEEPVKEEAANQAPLTFNLDNSKTALPAWLEAVEQRRNNK